MSDLRLEKRPLNYMPQLDGLRALAVFAVWISHWGPSNTMASRWFPAGPLGVRLFFVLSGFLISGILLNVKKNIDAGNETLGFAARRFYFRRSLRIFPIYYLVLLVTLPVIGQMRPHAIYNFTYTSNVFFAREGGLRTIDSPLWTLSVEEQFYLVWPWIILCIPRRFMVNVMLATLVIGPIFRAVMALVLSHTFAGYVLPLGSLDAFALGGLLALLSDTPQHGRARFLLCRIGLILGLPAAIIVQWLNPQMLDQPWYTIIFPLATAGVFTWLIGNAARGFHGIAGSILQNTVLVYLGRISYGLYLYHPFVTWGLDRGLAATHHQSNSVWGLLVVRALITTAVSIASWQLLEKPISRLKKYLDYTPDPVNQPLAPALG